MLDRLKLGFNYLEGKSSNGKENISSVYIKYQEIGKRKFYWTIWEQRKGNYNSYNDFKQSWDRDTKIWKTIANKLKSDLKSDLNKLIGNTNPFERRLDNNKPINRIIETVRRR